MIIGTGSADRSTPVGSLARVSAFSLYPVNPITIGEGDMVATYNEAWTPRQAIAAQCDAAFADMKDVEPSRIRDGVHHAYHISIIRLGLENLRIGRGRDFDALRAEGIGVNVNYIPVHLHHYYQETFGTKVGDLPVTEDASVRILPLTPYPYMTDGDVAHVAEAVRKVRRAFRR